MRLLHVTHQYRPAIGGAEQYITGLSEELARRGHQVTVFTSQSCDYLTWRSELPAVELLDGVQVHRFRSLVRGPRTWRMLDYGYGHYWRTRWRGYEPLILLGNGPVCPGLFWAVLRQSSSYDLVHISHLHYAHAALAGTAARLRGVPTVITPHLHMEQPVTHDVGYLRTILKKSAHIVADSLAERQFLIGLGFDPQRVTTAGSGIRVEQFPVLDSQACRHQLGLPQDAFVLLFLGRKTEYKGLDLALETFTELRRRYPKLCMLSMGPETEHPARLRAHPELPGLTNYENVSDETRLAALNASDCLVLPSAGEAFGIVYLEAWAVGKPVIGVQTPAVASIVTHGQDGWLISPGSSFELAACLSQWLENPGLAHQMGRSGQEKVLSRFTVPRIADIVEGVYLRVLRRHGHQSHQTQSEPGQPLGS
jgi:glycosyltransferase involved in cell wall biosynthesis